MKKFFIFFAATCIASAAWSDAVYEPLIVSSGFNRDVIAEQIDTKRTSGQNPSGVADYAQSYYDDKVSIHYIYPTKTTIRLRHGDAVDEPTNVYGTKKDENGQSVTDYDNILITARPIDTAFPDDNGGPEDRRIDCMSPLYPGLYWMLGAYDVPNALCMRRNMTNVGMESKGLLLPTGKFEFKTIGCYQKLYFMVVAGGSGAKSRIIHTRVHYSDRSYSDETFTFVDHASTQLNERACHDNIFSSEWWSGSWLTKLNCFAAVCAMNVETHHLIDSISFRLNDATDAGIAIFAVTGLTADIAAPDANPDPDHAPLRATEITANAISVEWDAVEGAASYRIDVATDEDFHHMVDGFNNEAVITSPDTVITGLDADHEYYWRVRAVDSEGGQSASSAPRRARTEGTNGPKATNDDDHDLKTNDITPLLNTTTNLTINRKLYKDGYYNTLCLPFDQSAADLAETTNPLYGFTIYEFEKATKTGEAQLDISVTVTDHIEAGVPYLLDWPTQTDEVLTSLEFKGVTIMTDEGRTIGGPDEVQFVGNISTTGENGMENGNRNHLFIGANNELFWPNTSNGLKGFRAHFEVPVSGPSYVPRNSPARIVVQTNAATGVESTSANSAGAKKQLENGQLVIIRDNIRYNVMGLKLR